jgi:ferredoxin-NADP reductase
MISTRIRDTPYKKRLSSLEERAKVKVRGPERKFVLHDDYSKPAVFLSGGIGVTPFRSMIKYATDERLPVRINMFDSNRDQTNILYKNEFDECLKTNNTLKKDKKIIEIIQRVHMSPRDVCAIIKKVASRTGKRTIRKER